LSGGFPDWTTAYLIGTAGGGVAAVVPPGECLISDAAAAGWMDHRRNPWETLCQVSFQPL
jgi:hypothetical protein